MLRDYRCCLCFCCRRRQQRVLLHLRFLSHRRLVSCNILPQKTVRIIRFYAPSDDAPAAGSSVMAYLREGWQVLRADRSLMSFIVYIGLINLFTTGPVMVGAWSST